MIRVTNYRELCEMLEKNPYDVKCFVGLDTIDKDLIGNSYICIQHDKDEGVFADNSLHCALNKVTIFLVSKDLAEFNALNTFIRNTLGVCGVKDEEDIYYRFTYDIQLIVENLQ